MNIHEHITNKDHEKILKLDGDQYKIYKGIALIYLNRYPESLYFLPKNTYERAYAYYKLKKYKKALKTLKNLENTDQDKRNNNESIFILMSQIYYKMKYFYSAYYFLSKVKLDDEVAVNLTAIKALAIAKISKNNIGCKDSEEFVRNNFDKNFNIDKFNPKYNDKFNDKFNYFEPYDFIDNECKKENDYNKMFINVDSFLIENLNSNNEHVLKQRLNLKGDFEELRSYQLTKRQENIIKLNEEFSNYDMTKKVTDGFYPDGKVFEEKRELKDFPMDTMLMKIFWAFKYSVKGKTDKALMIIDNNEFLQKFKPLFLVLMGKNVEQEVVEQALIEFDKEFN
ncbi:Signal recognition particle subunit SRP72 [Dictyocoela muelleri]|nr:Signal recognition particle subunit SRP72 [Dictyocoela muelleri]